MFAEIVRNMKHQYNTYLKIKVLSESRVFWSTQHALNTVEAAYYNRGWCYQSAIVINSSGPKTLHLKSIKNKPFILINLSVIFIKLQIIPVHI